jgi:hypothetical protein
MIRLNWRCVGSMASRADSRVAATLMQIENSSHIVSEVPCPSTKVRIWPSAYGTSRMSAKIIAASKPKRLSASVIGPIVNGAVPASAQIGGFGTSTAGGSGGTPTGPTNFTGIYGQSTAGGSGGLATGPTNFSTSGFGLSTGAGSGGRATGPTNPVLPQFGTTPFGTTPSGSSARAFGGGPASGGGVLGPSIMAPEGSSSGVLGPSIMAPEGSR